MNPSNNDNILVMEWESLSTYLSSLLSVVKLNHEVEIIKKCSAKISSLTTILKDFTTASFADVFIKDFEKSPKEMLDVIKEKSNDFSPVSPYHSVIQYIRELDSRLDTNVFIRNAYIEVDIGLNQTITSLPEVLQDYLRVGEELKDQISMTNLKRDLSLLKHSSDAIFDPGYYAAIIGPSFLGKTQTAFTLSHLMNVIYVNLLSVPSKNNGSTTVPVNDRDDVTLSQLIYDIFQNFSKLFSLTIEEDFKETTNYAAIHLKNHVPGFYTLGLIYCLIVSRKLSSTEISEEGSSENLTEVAERNFLQQLNINKAIIPKMNVLQFTEKITSNLISISLTFLNTFLL